MKHSMITVLCLMSMPYMYASLQIEKPLVVVVPAYNNAKWYKKNLDSIFSQKYCNYRVIYIDDCSTDDTYELVKNYLYECGQQDRVTLIRNEVNRGIFANHYRAVHQCEDFEIVLNVDSDDWLKDDQVFNKVNQAYADSAVWMTYGQFESWPEEKAGFCKRSPQHVVAHNAYREVTWRASHMRTFYAWLFKRIKLKDCLHQDGMYRLCADMVMMYPMLEMAGDKHLHVMSDVLYVYNESEAKPCFGQKYLTQLHLSRAIRNGQKYRVLDDAQAGPRQIEARPAIVIESHNRPMHLCALLDSLYTNGKNSGTVRVLYDTQSAEVEQAYQQLRYYFSDVEFIKLRKGDSFKGMVLDALRSLPGSYVALATDELVVHKAVDFKKCIERLEHTQAGAFYLALGANIRHTDVLEREQKQPPLIFLGDGVYAWQLKHGEYDWRQFISTDLTLYRKDDIYTALSDVSFDSFTVLSSLLAHYYVDSDAVGLCLEQSVLFQPIYSGKHTSLDDLCELFNYGFKIDLEPLSALTASSLKCYTKPLLKPRVERKYAL